MRKIFTVILIGTLTLTLLGCQKQPEEIPNSYFEETEPEVVEEIKESDSSSEELNITGTSKVNDFVCFMA